jgi:hypothetical protein
MKLERMRNIPETREEFERNFHVLAEKMKEGKIKFARGLDRTINGLLRVRKLPNGRIDFLTVDESARLMANMTAEMGEMHPPVSQTEEEQSQHTDHADRSGQATESIPIRDEEDPREP